MSTLFDDLPFPRPTASTEAARDAAVDAFGVPTWAEAAAAGEGPDGPGARHTDPEELLAGLNPQQREAVLHEGSPLLIVAGAGSGKTRVLTHRIAYLLGGPRRPARADPRDHLHQQGRRRDARAGRRAGRPARAKAMWVSTFHSACVRILRREAAKVGLQVDLLDLRRRRLASG